MFDGVFLNLPRLKPILSLVFSSRAIRQRMGMLSGVGWFDKIMDSKIIF
jgi:hypothetical protein